jgi:hypothetical protein
LRPAPLQDHDAAPEFSRRFAAFGYEMVGGTVADFARFLRTDIERYRRLAQAAASSRNDAGRGATAYGASSCAISARRLWLCGTDEHSAFAPKCADLRPQTPVLRIDR